MSKKFLNDESGAVLSTELIFVVTLLVIGVVVGLSEVQYAVNSELNDLGNAVGHVNQSYYTTGFSANKGAGAAAELKAASAGSSYKDDTDLCDSPDCSDTDLGCNVPVPECHIFSICDANP